MLILALGLLVTGAVADETHTTRLRASDDAYVDSSFPATNFGQSTSLYLCWTTGGPPPPGGPCMTFLQFDISDFSGSGVTVLNAELWLRKHEKYGAPDSTATVTCHHITTPGWNENTITWNSPPGYSTTPTTGSTGTFNPPGWAAWNVTPDVIGDVAGGMINGWNSGWCLKIQGPSPVWWLNFWSDEQVPMPDYRPVLEITYSGPVASKNATWGSVKNLYR